jgi:DNA-binding response OmpR family regulator
MKPILLIADNDTKLCALYQRFLSEQGFEVETASNGLECLEKLCHVRPAALVLDLELHWGGGEGVLARLNEGNGAAEVAVVLTATTGSLSDLPEDLQMPVVQILHKPFSLLALLEAVRAAVASERPGPPIIWSRTADRMETVSDS